jgi:hypothetical protein
LRRAGATINTAGVSWIRRRRSSISTRNSPTIGRKTPPRLPPQSQARCLRVNPSPYPDALMPFSAGCRIFSAPSARPAGSLCRPTRLQTASWIFMCGGHSVVCRCRRLSRPFGPREVIGDDRDGKAVSLEQRGDFSVFFGGHWSHAKLMLVDDEWVTVGSCNLHRFSLFGNGEMNAAFSEPNTVRAFRCELLREHLDQDTFGMDDRDSLHLFRKIAREAKSVSRRVICRPYLPDS